MKAHVHGPRLAAPALGLMLIACGPAFAAGAASAGEPAKAAALPAKAAAPARKAGPPAEAAPAAKAGLTQPQLARLLQVVDKRGSRVKIPPAVSSTLELAPAQVGPDIKQVAFVDGGGIKHGFGPLNDGSGFFMFHSAPAFGQSVFHVDSKLQLVRAARSFRTDRMMNLPDDEASKELREELGAWSKTLSAAPAVVPPPNLPASPPKGAKP